MKHSRNPANNLLVLTLLSIAVIAGLSWLLVPPQKNPSIDGESARTGELYLYCAAGMRYPMEKIIQQYQEDFGVTIETSFKGSNTLLSELEIGKTGDLYLAADDSYVQLARERGLAVESIPLARLKPVIAVRKDNPRGIAAVDDLLAGDVKVAIGDPDATAVGKKTKKLLTASGHWERLAQRVTANGVSHPTVNEVANAVKLGSVDVGITWDSTVAQYPELTVIEVPELDAGQAQVELAVLASSKKPTAALKFARFVAARDRGLQVFNEFGFDIVEGDQWVESPTLTLFAGAVNRAALKPVIEQFERREGVSVTTRFDGCGILTAQMRTMQENQESGFPDSYMACDIYYLKTVKEMFEAGRIVSDTDIVIVVPQGNPKGVKTLDDLARPGMRVAVGQPDQCTIGILTRRLLQDAGLYEKMFDEGIVVTQATSSAQLVPAVATGSVDAVLAYATDTRAESDKVDAIRIDAPTAHAQQPFTTALRSDHKQLSRRLYDHIARSREAFESAGFNFHPGEAIVGEADSGE